MQTIAVGTAKHVVIGETAAPAAAQSASEVFQFTTNEGDRMLRIISQTWRIKRHYELFQLLQGEVQYFIPHQILISAWGDFLGSSLEHDVISALPGVRTGCLEGCDIDHLLKDLHARWLAHGRQPMLFSSGGDEGLVPSGCECALHRSLKSMSSIMVHGVRDARDGTSSLYLMANAGPIVTKGGIENFRVRVDPIISQIDVAFRRVAGLNSRAIGAFERQARASGGDLLSAREAEILMWVSKGRTNIEISKILAISTFTVKNHVQRIIKKLRAANRTEAVVKYRQLSLATQQRASSRGDGHQGRGRAGPGMN